MDGNARSTVNQKKPIVADNELVELLWHNGSVVEQSQTHQRAANTSDRGQSTSGLTGEETAAWFPDALNDGLEHDMYTQLWHSMAGAAPDVGMLPGPSSHRPPDFAHLARLPMRSGIDSSWTGDICSTFCGSNQVTEVQVGGREKNAALASERMRGASAHDGAGTSSSGGSGSHFGGSGLPSESPHSGIWAETTPIAAVRMLSVRQLKRPNRPGDMGQNGGVGQPKFRTSQRRRRDRINEKMRALQELIPHCNKVLNRQKFAYVLPTPVARIFARREYFLLFCQADKASILDEAIEYLKSLHMQVQIMWMTTGMAPMMFPGAHQFVPPMAVGMNSACLPAAQGINQMPRLPYMSHFLPNHIPVNATPSNPLYVANRMQNIHLRDASNHFLHPNGGPTAAPQVPRAFAYAPQVAQNNRIPEVPACTVAPTSGPTQPPTLE